MSQYDIQNGANYQNGSGGFRNVPVALRNFITNSVSKTITLKNTILTSGIGSPLYREIVNDVAKRNARQVGDNAGWSFGDNNVYHDDLGIPYRKDGTTMVVIADAYQFNSTKMVAGLEMPYSSRRSAGSYMEFDGAYNRIIVSSWFAAAFSSDSIRYKNTDGSYSSGNFETFILHEFGHSADLFHSYDENTNKDNKLNNYAEKIEMIADRNSVNDDGSPKEMRSPHGEIQFHGLDGGWYSIKYALENPNSPEAQKLKDFQEYLRNQFGYDDSYGKNFTKSDAPGIMYSDPNSTQNAVSLVNTIDAIGKGLTTIDGAQIGIALGTVLGRRITSNPFGQIVGSGILSTTLGALGEFIDVDILNGKASTTFFYRKDGQTTLSANFDQTLLQNIKGAGIGALSSYLTAEFFQAVGLEGLPAEVANSAGGAVVSQIITNLTSTATVKTPFLNVDVAVINAIGSFIGTKLASEIHSFETVGGQIGSATGSIAGGFAATVALAALAPEAVTAAAGATVFSNAAAFAAANPVVAVAVVAAIVLLSTLFGGLIGSVFGGTPRSGADVTWDETNNEFDTTNVYSKKGGSKDAARGVADAVGNNFEAVLGATGATLLDPRAVQTGNYGMRKSDFVYRPVSSRDKDDITARFSGKDGAQKLINHGTYLGLESMLGQLAGGDIYVKRALAGSLANAGGNPDGNAAAGAAGQFDMTTLLGDASTAQDYANYLQNSSAINALIAADPQTSFAAGWLVTLAHAAELGLNRRSSTDWVGGFQIFMDEAADGVIGGNKIFASQLTADIDAITGARYWTATDNDGAFLGFIEDTIEEGSQTTIVGTSTANTIDLRSGSLADQSNYIVDGKVQNDIAISGTDFTAKTAQVTFTATSLRQFVDIQISNNSPAESLETFLVQLSNASNMNIIKDTGTVTIIDGNATKPTLSVGRSFAYEADNYAIFRLTLSETSTNTINVDLSVSDVTATGGGTDYGSALQYSADGLNSWQSASSVTFAPGTTVRYVRVPVTNTTTSVEGNEQFKLNATVATGSIGFVANATASGIGTIIDGSSATPLVWVDDMVVDEGSPNKVTVSVARNKMISGNQTVDFTTADRRQLNIDIAASVDGGDGNDLIYASDKGDNLFGGLGADTLYGGRLDDWLFGGDGNDILDAASLAAGSLGGDGNYLDGGIGDDTLNGREGSDWLEGGDGTDFLYGNEGSDILAGGAGLGDRSYGGIGGDQYLFRLGDGADIADDGIGVAAASDSLAASVAAKNADSTIRDWDGTGIYAENGAPYGSEDRVVFGIGIGLGDITLKRSGTSAAPGMDLIVAITQGGVATGDQLTLTGWFDSPKRVEWLEFSDGQAIRISDFTTFTIGTGGNDVIIGTNGNDFVVAGDGDDHLQLLGGDDVGIGGRGRDEIGGDDGRDILIGGSDADMILGGSGDDMLSGDGGDDDLNGGIGKDIISGGRGNDMMAGAAGNDIFKISRGDGRDTIVDDYAGTWETVWIGSSGYQAQAGYTYDQATNRVLRNGTEVVFDGSNWIGRFNFDYNTSTNTGTLSRLAPAAGGQVGKDNSTTDLDVLEFAVGINIQDLELRKSGNDLLIGISSENANDADFTKIADQILLEDWFISTTANSPIERFVFAAIGNRDMTTTNVAFQSTDGNDSLVGGTTNDWITGNAGDDTLDGGGGYDILVGNMGQDSLRGGALNDVLYGGAGDDILDGGADPDTLDGGEGLDTASYASSTTSVNAYLADTSMNSAAAIGDRYYSIENLQGAGQADRFGGSDEDNVLNGGNGNDTLSGGLGSDTYVIDANSGTDTILEGAFVVEEAVNAGGTLGAGYTKTWTSAGTVSQSGSTFYKYRLVVTNAASEVVYDGYMQYATATPTAPAPSGWDAAGWTAGFSRANNNNQVTRHKIDATVSGGSDDTIEFGKGISLSDLQMSWSGNDLLITGLGSATILGQAIANRRIEYLQLEDGLSARFDNLRLNTNGVDAVDDLIMGTAAADTLSGLSGNDILSGAAGNDSLSGGDGDDALEGGAGADTLSGGLGSDTVRYVRSATAVTVNLTLTGAQLATANGDAANDVLSGIENVVGSLAGNDVLTGDGSDNRLFGLDGNDTLTGNAGNDVLVGDLGNDLLNGGDGEDNISGGDGNDTIGGGNDKDVIDAGIGADLIHGDAADDFINGGGDNDTLYGDLGADSLVGGDGDDIIYGGDQNDQIIGGAGNDTLRGENGDDVFSFSASSGIDTIIDASGVNVITFDPSVDYRNIWLARTNNDLVISVVGGTSQVTLSNYYTATPGTTVRYIATSTHAIYLAYAQPLITQMQGVALTAPASVPATVSALQDSYWWAGGSASPVAADIPLVTNEDVVSTPRGTGAVDHDENITSYSIVTNATNGVATINATTGQFYYSPNANYFGTDSFVLSVKDTDGHETSLTVNVTVNSVNDAPYDIALTPLIVTGVPENSAGAIVGDLSALDVDLAAVSDFGQSIFTTSDTRFEVIGGKTLKLKPGVSLDYETTATTSVSITATDRNGAGLSFTKAITVTVHDESDIVNGTSGPDTLTGTNGGEAINGLGGNDTIAGLGGNDTIDGGDGNDSINAGDGDDIVVGGTGADSISGGNDNDNLSGGSQNDTILGGSGVDMLNGDADDDTLYGDAGNDALNGGDGNDRLFGGSGADALNGGLGSDIADYAIVDGGVAAGAGILASLVAPGSNTGAAAGDSYNGIEGLSGTGYADTLYGDGAANILSGVAGNDAIYGGVGNDVISGGDGNDTLRGEDDHDVLNGDNNNDILYGGLGNDTLNGGAGDDQLFAEGGNDQLDGGTGNDTMSGDAGDDTYIITRSSALDLINNYHTDAGDNDVLGYQDSIVDRDLWFQHINNDLVITVIGTGTVTTIKDWYLHAGLSDETNYQIKFIEASVTRVINAEGLVTLMASYRSSAPTVADRDSLMANPTYFAQWTNYWGDNPAPILDAISTKNTAEDTPLTVSVHATDMLDSTTPASPGSVNLLIKVYNKYTGQEDYSLLSSTITQGSADSGYNRNITFNPVANQYGTAEVRIWASDAGGRYSDMQSFDVVVGAKADMPTIVSATAGAAANGKGTFEGGAAIPLNLSVNFPDIDGSETQSVMITGVPGGVNLNNGATYNASTGTWTVAANQLAGLAMTGPAGFYQDFTVGIQARAVEGSNGDTATTGIAYTNVYVNAPPTGISANGSIIENTLYGGGGFSVAAIDPDVGDYFSYSLLDDAGARFSMTSSGSLTVLNGPIDYEASPTHTYRIKVRATDNSNQWVDQYIDVPIGDANERPTFTQTGPFGPVPENSGAGVGVGTVSATDPDSYNPSYGTKHYYFQGANGRSSADGSFAVSNISQDGKFQIDVNTGQITTTGASLNYEGTSAYTETVYVTDDINNSTARMNSVSIGISIDDVNEKPILSPLSISIAEQPADPTNYRWTMIATDPDTADPAKRNLYYTLSGPNSNYFQINSSNGKIALIKDLNYEDSNIPKSFNLNVTVYDQGPGGGLSDTQPFSVNVYNINEVPVVSVTGAWSTGDIRGNLLSGYILANDPDSASGSAAPFTYNINNFSYYDTPTGTWKPGYLWYIDHSGGYYEGSAYPHARFDATVTDAGNLTGTYQADFRYPGYFGPPIILDLDGNGVELTSLQSSTVRFDMNNDGVRDITGWASSGDGILSIDLNHNGIIDDASEISFQPNISGAISDLEGLRSYDTNNDGFIDIDDAQFADFKIWQDLNQDGISDPGELRTLAEADIAALNLTLTPTGNTWTEDSFDNVIYGNSEYIRTDGSIGSVGDVFFTYITPETATVILGTHQNIVGIDLDGDGVNVIDLRTSGISFDMSGNGGASTAWISANDAMLAIDLDGDGTINNGTELALGDDHLTLSPLKAYDSNADGIVDQGDARFGDFRIWQDQNQDGVSQTQELKSLNDAGITAFKLSTSYDPFTVGNGESKLYTDIEVTMDDGSTGSAGGILLAYDEPAQTSAMRMAAMDPQPSDADSTASSALDGQVHQMIQAMASFGATGSSDSTLSHPVANNDAITNLAASAA